MQEVQENQDNAKQQSNVPQMIENVLKNEGVQALLFSIAKAIEGKVTTPAVDGVGIRKRKIIFEERRMESWRRNRRTHLWTYTGLVAGVFICLSLLVFAQRISETIYATLVSALIGYVFGQIKNSNKASADTDKV